MTTNTRTLAAVLRTAVGLFASATLCSACSDGADESTAKPKNEAAALSKAFANLEPWCDKSAECGVSTREQCLEGDYSEAEVDDAVAALDPSEKQIKSCTQAIHDWDACMLALSCPDVVISSRTYWNEDGLNCTDEEFEMVDCPEDLPCTDPQRRFFQDCQELQDWLFESRMNQLVDGGVSE